MPKKNNDSRPVNLDLTTISLPITAVTSILHRISGFALFIIIPLFLYTLQLSLTSRNGFIDAKVFLDSLLIKFLVWLSLSGLIYHALAGLRHLLMDIHVGDTKQGGRQGSYIVLVASIILSIIAGVCLW